MHASRCICMSSLSCGRKGWTRECLICKCGEGVCRGYTSSNRLNIRWVLQDQYLLKPALWKPIQVDCFLQYFSTRDQCQQIDSEAGLLTRISQKKYLDFLHSQSLNISTKGDLRWVHGHVSRRKWQGFKDDQVSAYKNLTRRTTYQVCSCVYIAD